MFDDGYNYKITLDAFYKGVKTNFSDIDLKKLYEIKARSKELNNIFNCEHFKQRKSQRYTKIMEFINSGHRKGVPTKSKYATTTDSEKLLLFMYSIDPNFEAAIIFGSKNNTKEIKKQMEKEFGIYDLNLIKIEQLVIKKFLSEKKRQEIYDEIDKRSFK